MTVNRLKNKCIEIEEVTNGEKNIPIKVGGKDASIVFMLKEDENGKHYVDLEIITIGKPQKLSERTMEIINRFKNEE